MARRKTGRSPCSSTVVANLLLALLLIGIAAFFIAFVDEDLHNFMLILGGLVTLIVTLTAAWWWMNPKIFGDAFTLRVDDVPYQDDVHHFQQLRGRSDSQI